MGAKKYADDVVMAAERARQEAQEGFLRMASKAQEEVDAATATVKVKAKEEVDAARVAVLALEAEMTLLTALEGDNDPSRVQQEGVVKDMVRAELDSLRRVRAKEIVCGAEPLLVPVRGRQQQRDPIVASETLA